MRFHDIWVAGTGGALGDRLPVQQAVADGRYSQEAQDSTGMVAISRSDLAPPEMAVVAGRQAVKEAGEIGVEVGTSTALLHSHGNFQGIDMWPAACWIANQLIGVTLDGMPFSVSAASNGSLASLEVAACALTARPDLPNVLITLADRFEPPADRWYLSPGMIFGDGAASAVVTRGHGRLRLDSVVAETDTALEGLSRGALPFTSAPEGQPDTRLRTREFLARSGISLRDVRHRSAERVRSVVTRALADADTSLDDIAWYLTPFVGRALMKDSFLRPLAVPPERVHTPRNTLADLALTIGHLGPADGIFALDHLIRHDLLTSGDRVLVVGTGMGFTFSAAVLTAA